MFDIFIVKSTLAGGWKGKVIIEWRKWWRWWERMKRRQRVVNSQRGINLDKCIFTTSSIWEQISLLFVNIISLSSSRTLLSTWTNKVEHHCSAVQLFPHWNIFYILTTILMLNWNSRICTVVTFFVGNTYLTTMLLWWRNCDNYEGGWSSKNEATLKVHSIIATEVSRLKCGVQTVSQFSSTF